jgi:MFS family permease
MAIFLLASLGYIATRSVEPILALRLFHGVGMGLFPTAATVVIAELAPPARRGEATGWFGITNSLGLILGPVLGPAVAGHLGFPVLFLLAAGVAGVGMACICLVPAAERPARRSRLPRPGDLFSPAAVLPSLILLLLYIPYGTVVAFIPLVATTRGLENPGLFYTVFAAAMLLVRAKAGEISDRRGRAAVIVPGMIVTVLSFLVLGVTTGWIGVLAGGALLGLGFGSAQPALMALTTDRVAPAERGKAMGTFYGVGARDRIRRRRSRLASERHRLCRALSCWRRHSTGWSVPRAEGTSDRGSALVIDIALRSGNARLVCRNSRTQPGWRPCAQM